MDTEKQQSDDNDMIEIDETYEEVLDDQDDENGLLNKTVTDLDDVLASKVKIPQPTSTTTTANVATTAAAASAAAETTTVKQQITTNAIASNVAGGSQKIVIIQNGANTGGKQQIRMASGSQIRSVGSASANGIQLIKTSEGTYIQLKNKSSDGNSAGTSTITGGTGGRFIVKSSNGNRILLSTPTSIKPVATQAGSGNSLITLAGSSVTKTITAGGGSGGGGGGSRQVTVAEAQKLGLISSAKYKEIVSVVNKHQKSQQQLSNVTTTTTTSTATIVNSSKLINATATTVNQSETNKPGTLGRGKPVAIIEKRNAASGSLSFPAATTLISQQKLQSLTAGKPNIGGAAKKIIIQTSSGVQKQVMLPSHLYELAQKGQIRAVSIAGKGVQYVRVASATTPTTTSTKPSSTITSAKPINHSSSSVMSISTNSKLPTTESSSEKKILSHGNRGAVVPKDSGGLNVPVSQTIGLKVEKKPHPYQIMAVKRYSDQSSVNTTDQKRIINFEKTASSQVRRSTPSIMYSGGNSTVKLEVNRDTSNNDLEMDANDSQDNRFGRPRMYHNNQNINLKYEGDKNEFPSPSKTHTYTPGTAALLPPSTNLQPMIPPLIIPPIEEPEGIRRKHCNCTKSQCLKLYCDCFANGEFCANCNCKDCFNNLENQDERQKAIRMCLERNPHAFKPKIGKAKDQTDQLSRRHNKGCNCKRSGCLKNYCECYEAKIGCSDNCRCVDCRNFDDHSSANRFATNILAAPSGSGGGGGGGSSSGNIRYQQNRKNYLSTELAEASIDTLAYLDKSRPIQLKRKRRSMSNSSPSPSPPSNELHSLDLLSTSSYSMMGARSGAVGGRHSGVDLVSDLATGSSLVGTKKPCNFMTPDVIEATIQCLIAQADECQKNNINPRLAEKLIIEEFGRCLVEIIEFSLKNNENE